MAAYPPPNDLPSYADHRASGSFDPNVPPRPPPKPRSEDVSRQSTPVLSQFPHQPSPLGAKPSPPTPERSLYAEQVGPQGAPQAIPDPGPNWLPKILEDKSYVFCFCIKTSPLTSLVYKILKRFSGTPSSSPQHVTPARPSTPPRLPLTNHYRVHCARI